MPLPTFRGAVPVLTFHGIDPLVDSKYTITPASFARQMAMLKQAGFHPISAEQYAKFPGGSAKDLPSRPILITFDDGQLDSYRYADPILKRFGFRATMFVITDPVDRATRSTCAGTSSASCATRAAGTSSSTPARCTRWSRSTPRARRAPRTRIASTGPRPARVLRGLPAPRDRRPRPRHAPPAGGARAGARRRVRLPVLRGRQLADQRQAHPGLPGPGAARALLRGVRRRPPAEAAAHRAAHAGAQGGQHGHDRRGAVRLARHRSADPAEAKAQAAAARRR